MPSSLCRLSSGSQFCLSHLTIGKLQTKLKEEEASVCLGTGTPNLCWEQEGALGAADAKSRNTSFMISLMDICNKMILPLASLNQDCDTCMEDDDSTDHLAQTPPRKSCCHLCQPRLSDSETSCSNSMGSQHIVGRQTNQHHQPNNTIWEDPGVENDCYWYSVNNNAETVCKKQWQQSLQKPQYQQHPKSSWNPPNQVSNQRMVIKQQRSGNNHNSNPGKTTQRERQQQLHMSQHCCSKSRSQPTVRLNPTQSPELEQPSSVPLDAEDSSGGCVIEAPSSMTGSSAEGNRPLLTDHGVPKWNLAEYQDFRANATSANNPVYEPMHHSGPHRHLVILDSQWRLKTAVSNFRVHVYRPY